LLELIGLNDAQFRARFVGSPVLRSKRRGLARNVAVALGNSRNPAAVPALRAAASDADPLVREHAIWALERL
jgi:epoxyqueuosine reductase